MPVLAQTFLLIFLAGAALQAAAQEAPTQAQAAATGPEASGAERAQRSAAAAQVAAAIEMVSIPGGSFQMGNAKGFSDEKPVHRVTIRPFRLGKYEVTFEQYDPYCQLMLDECPEDGGWGRGRLPVVNVSWEDANAFARWLSTHSGRRFRLPSEAEWEYAARGGTTTAFPWANKMRPGMANCDSSCADPFAHTSPAGSFPVNGFGLYDMPGNVWEWTQDCYNSTYVGAPDDGSAWTTGSCSVRVVRGGSWATGYEALRSADRDWDRANYRSGTRSRGFRLAEDP